MARARNPAPPVGVVMGSDSDWPVMQAAVEACAEFGVACEVRVLSAHRTPRDMARWAGATEKKGIRVVIAGAGGAAHLPGMVAAHTVAPVIGVPVESRSLKGLDSLLSIVQMPSGVPVATVAINGGRNAGLLAVAILAASDADLRKKLARMREAVARESRGKTRKVARDAASLG